MVFWPRQIWSLSHPRSYLAEGLKPKEPKKTHSSNWELVFINFRLVSQSNDSLWQWKQHKIKVETRKLAPSALSLSGFSSLYREYFDLGTLSLSLCICRYGGFCTAPYKHTQSPCKFTPLSHTSYSINFPQHFNCLFQRQLPGSSLSLSNYISHYLYVYTWIRKISLFSQ